MRNGQTRKRLDGRRSNCCDRDGGTARNAIAHALDDLTGIKRPRQAARFVISREEKTRRGGLTEGKGLRNKIPSESCFNFFSERRVLTRGKSFSTYRSVLVFFLSVFFRGVTATTLTFNSYLLGALGSSLEESTCITRERTGFRATSQGFL